MTHLKINPTVYILAGICITLCVIVIIFGLRILKETRELEPRKSDEPDDNSSQF